MSTRDLIDAIESGDSVAIQNSFEQAMAERIADRIDTMRQEVAKNMFNEGKMKPKMSEESQEIEEESDLDEATAPGAAKPAKVHPDALHVQHVGGGKYKVHAVGKNFADGIKPGEHLSDTELDDFSEMGGKIKHVK